MIKMSFRRNVDQYDIVGEKSTKRGRPIMAVRLLLDFSEIKKKIIANKSPNTKDANLNELLLFPKVKNESDVISYKRGP